MNNLPVYRTEETAEETKIQFLFASVGKRTIIKAIEYTPLAVIGTTTLYNLGFGDYDPDIGTIVDDVNSNNGDMRIVFNTVLHTVPLLFAKKKEAAILISGSDSHAAFIYQCLPNCKKKCESQCKNFQRRIKTYRYFVDKNFEVLRLDYIFFGRNKKINPLFVEYIPYNQYDDILVYPKK